MNYCSRMMIAGMLFLSFLLLIACENFESELSQPENVKINVNDLRKTWAGEYEGWDSLMNAKFHIFRRLVLNSDSTYTNVLGAVIDLPNASEEPAPIEKEAGTYVITYNDSTGVVNACFDVAYDSIIDFGTQVFLGYDHKHYYTPDGKEHTDSVYHQSFKIVRGEKGTFQLECVDTLLYSLDGKSDSIIYYMKEGNKERE